MNTKGDGYDSHRLRRVSGKIPVVPDDGMGICRTVYLGAEI